MELLSDAAPGQFSGVPDLPMRIPFLAVVRLRSRRSGPRRRVADPRRAAASLEKAKLNSVRSVGATPSHLPKGPICLCVVQSRRAVVDDGTLHRHRGRGRGPGRCWRRARSRRRAQSWCRLRARRILHHHKVICAAHVRDEALRADGALIQHLAMGQRTSVASPPESAVAILCGRLDTGSAASLRAAEVADAVAPLQGRRQYLRATYRVGEAAIFLLPHWPRLRTTIFAIVPVLRLRSSACRRHRRGSHCQKKQQRVADGSADRGHHTWRKQRHRHRGRGPSAAMGVHTP
mmetsp:Transcript_52785/g.112992  ORF Transcript_52785/g.112992 Transcript_52785/m.112992 type:complete len:290 (-) Transcript_52785:8-877(-)